MTIVRGAGLQHEAEHIWFNGAIVSIQVALAAGDTVVTDNERDMGRARVHTGTPVPADADFLRAAVEEARAGLAEGGVPIGSVLVHGGRVVGRGHNRRVQRGSAILHAEMDALENAGRLGAEVYREATLYTTLSPCAMCTGALLLYRIPRVVIGENRNFRGEEELLLERGVELEVVDDPECVELLGRFIRAHPELWDEDVGR